MSPQRLPVHAVYRGGPADGRTEVFVPSSGAAVDVRRVVVPPTMEDYEGLNLAEQGSELPASRTAEYRLVYGEFVDLDERTGFERDVAAGTHLVHGVYEFQRFA